MPGAALAALVGALASCGGSHRASPEADAGACEVAGGCADGSVADAVSCAPLAGDGRRRISQMGLYADVVSQVLAAGVLEYQPAYALWTDGADKRRFIALPDGARIDTSDMNHWKFPVGTKLFKEFSIAGQRLETRVIERIANTGSEADYSLSAFIWSADGCDAVESPLGAANVLGTTHDVPDRGQCLACHGGEPGRVLGFSAIQLSKPGPPPTLASLVESGRLTAPPPAGANYAVPGPAATAAALGYLHANCGHCHNPKGAAPASTLSMNLRLDIGARTPEATTIWRTTVGVATEFYQIPGAPLRVAAQKPDASAVLYRMGKRRNTAQMPPLATKIVDDAGLATLQAWIASLRAP